MDTGVKNSKGWDKTMHAARTIACAALLLKKTDALCLTFENACFAYNNSHTFVATKFNIVACLLTN